MADNEIRVVITGVASDLRAALDGAKGDLGGLKAAIKDVPNTIKVDVQADVAAATERLRVLRDMAKDVPSRISIEATADTGVAQAKLRLLQSQARDTEQAIARAQLGGIIPTGGGGGGLGGAAGAAGSGAGGLAGVGPAVAVGAPAIAAGLGSIVALAGSASAALLGLGAVASSVFAVGGVGFGSMFAVFKSASAGIKQVQTAMDALSAAQQKYGDNSKQAQTAQKNLNVAINEAGPAAAEIAKQLSAIGDEWNKISQPAQRAMDGIIVPALRVVQQLLPTVAQIATQSFRAIGAALQPVFQGLSSPAFQLMLEKLGEQFARLASPAITAFANIMRAFFNVAVAAAPFMVDIATSFAAWTESLAKATAPGDKLNGIIKGLVGQLHTWFDLAVNVGKVMVTVFSAGAGTGQTLVKLLSGVLDNFNKWLNTKSGQDAMKKFFSDSANLIVALVKALAPLLGAVIKLVVDLMPTFTRLITDLTPALHGLAIVVSGVADLLKGGLANALETVVIKWNPGIIILSHLPDIIKAIGDALKGVAGIWWSMWNWMKGVFDKVVNFILGGISTTLHAMADMVGAATSLPILGDAFQLLAGHTQDSLNKMADGIDAYRRTLQPTADATKKNTDAMAASYAAMTVQTSSSLSQMEKDTASKLEAIRKVTASKMHDAADAAGKSLYNLAFNVQWAMQSGQISAQDGASKIAKELQAAVTAFGGKVIPAVVAVEKANIGGAINSAIGHLVPGGGQSGAAGGGWIGSPGERGGDNVPIVVGRGEAVLNHQQQGIVNSALGATGFGSLDNVFSSTAGSKHWMAAGGYVDPIPGFSLGRQDMGIDATAAPGAPILAIGDSTLSYTIPGWYAGQPLMGFRFDTMPTVAQSPYWYVAEQISPATMGVGAHFKAGQAVAHYAGSGTGIEIGWGAPPSGSNPQGTLAGAAGRGSEANPPGSTTIDGASFLAFIEGLAHGKLVGGGPGGGVAGIPAVVWKNLSAPNVTGTGTIPDMVRAVLKKETAAANVYGQKQAALATGVGAGISGAGVNPGTWLQVARQIAAKHGWNEAQVQDWLKLEGYEDGSLSLTATNPTSGAYGLAQFINGPSEYAAYGGNSTTMVGQLTAMANYIAQRYITPSAALAHELSTSPHWYAGGGYVGGKTGDGFARGGYAGAWNVMATEESDGGTGAFGFSPGGVGYSILGRTGRTSDGAAGAGYAFGARQSPPRPMYIRHAGRTITATLQDIGAGSDSPNPAPSIGLYPTAWGQLGMTDNSMVDVELTTGDSFKSLRGSVIPFFGALAGKGGSGGGSSSSGNKKKPGKVYSYHGRGPKDPRIKAPTFPPGLPIRPPQWAWGHKLPTTWGNAFLPTMAQGLESLDDLVNPNTGQIAIIGDRLAHSQAEWTIRDTEYGTAHPGLDESTGLFTPVAGGKATVDDPFVDLRTAQLEQAFDWQAKITADLKRAVAITGPLISELKARLLERRRQIVKFRERIRHNLKRIHKLRLMAHHEGHVKITAKGHRADVAGMAQAKHNAQAKFLEEENVDLGGSAWSIGSGGLLKSLGNDVTGLSTSLSGVTAERLALTGPSGGFGLLGQAKLDLRQAGDDLAVFSPDRLAKALAAANANLAPAGPDLALLNQLLTQQNQNQAAELATSQSQFQVMSAFMPAVAARMVGSFASGIDYVPHTGIALVHRGEQIIPDPGGPYGNQAPATVHTAQGNIEVVLVMQNNEPALMKLVDARMNQKGLQIISDHSGQRARLMSGVRNR